MASTAAVLPIHLGRALQHACRASPVSIVSSSWSSSSSISASSPSYSGTVSVSVAGSRAGFSTSAALQKRKTTRDNNRLRGVSSMRRSGPREPVSVMPAGVRSTRPEDSGAALPEPRQGDELAEAARAAVATDPDHGLWGFFYGHERLPKPVEQARHGRGWMVEELRAKSWEDLHRLWWTCVRERNRIATTVHERFKADIGFGENEDLERDRQVRLTMRAIKHVLTERYYVWEDARKLAAEDPEVDLSGDGPAYTPKEYFEAEEVDVSAVESSSTATAQDKAAEQRPQA